MNHPLRRITLIIILTNWFTLLISQQTVTKEFIKSVADADIVYLYDKDYLRAAGLYDALLQAHPGNANLKAKLGSCYLNIEEKKQESLNLLEQASSDVASDEEYIFYGEKAPHDTYLNLAKAYLINDSLEKAISTYNQVRSTLGKFDAPLAELIDIEISACRYAIEAKKKPFTVVSEFFTPWQMDYPGACNPVLSSNDSVFVFTQKTAGKTRILCSYKTKGEWYPPSDITDQLGGYDRFYSNSISGDGKLLILSMDDGGDGNLYFSQRQDTSWTKIKSPGRPINTIYWESHGFITPDKNAIYLVSNRPGGYGELDIWKSEKLPDGLWGEPVNCGELINTPGNEDTPFFNPASNELIFSSDGHSGMGGYDVFRSTGKNGTWDSPSWIPFSLNTTTDDKSFILNNNSSGIIASRFDEKSKTRNIYSLRVINPSDELTVTEGTITLGDRMKVNPGKAFVKLTDIKEGSFVRSIPVSDNGTFRMEVKPGDYKLFIGHTGYQTDTVNLNVPLYFLSHHLDVNSTLNPEKKTDAGFMAINNILFEFDSYKINEQAKSEMASLTSIITACPDLKFEVAGYTDARGSTAYNLKLAERRAQSVIDFLTSSAIPRSRLVMNAFGESYSAAINTNDDGSDNPEGRKYNRRVTLGVIDPQTGVVIRQDPYAPEIIRKVTPEIFSIVLKKSAERLFPDYFDTLKLNGVMFIKSYYADSNYVYTIGTFYNRKDAERYLVYARERGFTDAFIVNNFNQNM